jgi:hypothetical protein
MTFHRPISRSKRRGKAGGSLPPEQAKDGRAGGPGILGAWVQAEKMMQIALVLPCATFIGWLAGAWFDRHFHQSWIALVGLVFGGASGLVYVVRLALDANKGPAMQDKASNEPKKGSADKTS